jgi:hypothetical protein
MRLHHIAFLLPAMLIPSLATASGNQTGTPEAAQAVSKTKTTTTPRKPGGAASPSYAACAPGNPIGGIIVKGAKDQMDGAADSCAVPTQSEAAAREGGRTYTGGRRNEDIPSAAGAALAPGQPIKGVIVKGGGPNKPASLSIAPTTVKAVAPAAAQLKKESDE